MSIINDGTVICVHCRERMHHSKFTISSGRLGICKSCYSHIKPISPHSPLNGKSDIPYVICGYHYNNILKDLVYRYKFRGEYALGFLFSAMLSEQIRYIPDIYDFDFMTSVPISSKRFKARGFNQSEIIARNTAKALNIPYVQCVYKSKHTIAQSLLKRAERIQNVKNAFIADSEKVSNKRILLVDDLFTTGSTMNECASEILSKGASYVAGISFAASY